MRLEDYLQPEFVIGNLASESKSEVLAELVSDGRSSTPIDAFRIDRFSAVPHDEPALAH